MSDQNLDVFSTSWSAVHLATFGHWRFWHPRTGVLLHSLLWLMAEYFIHGLALNFYSTAISSAVNDAAEMDFLVVLVLAIHISAIRLHRGPEQLWSGLHEYECIEFGWHQPREVKRHRMADL